jgi:hypothetical protein
MRPAHFLLSIRRQIYADYPDEGKKEDFQLDMDEHSTAEPQLKVPLSLRRAMCQKLKESKVMQKLCKLVRQTLYKIWRF